MNRAILMDESHELDPWPLDEGPRPKGGKSRLNLHDTILERKSIGLDQNIYIVKKESSWFEVPRWKLGSKARSNSWVQFASNEFKLVPRSLDPRPPPKVNLNKVDFQAMGFKNRATSTTPRLILSPPTFIKTWGELLEYPFCCCFDVSFD